MSTGSEATEQGELFEGRDAGDALVVNDRVLIRASGEHRVVVVDGLAFQHFAATDRTAAAYAMITLVELGYADQNDVARAFGRTARSVRRYQERYERGGLESLARAGGRPRGSRPRSKTAGIRARAVLALKSEGHSNREIAKRLGISETAVRKRLKQQRWVEPDNQARLFGNAKPEESPSSPEVPSVKRRPPGEAAPSTDPLDRSSDRALAHFGLLDDAEPIFAPAASVPRVGVLLAIPGVVRSGVVEVARAVYGERALAPAFYGLRTTLVALVLLALLRIKRPEALKEHAPVELGRLLGLDRVPEVKTLRRKLAQLASAGKAIEFGRELARRRVTERGSMLGFLYVDGHVRVYHGKHEIPKAYHTQKRLAVPGTTDYFVNDKRGDPLFVVTAEANAGMIKMLLALTPDVRALVGQRRRPTFVFDRGGWSPLLFGQLLARGFDVLTYRKGRVEEIPPHLFRTHQARIDGRKVDYRLHDKRVPLLKGQLWLRQVTRISDDERHQTPILTSRFDLRAVEVAYRMFERWRQENFFKYMRDEFEIDALAEHAVEPDDPMRTVPNPARRAVDAELKTARAASAKLAQAYVKAAVGISKVKRPTTPGFKLSLGELKKKLRAARERVAVLRTKRAALPARVPVSEALGGAPVVKLAAERKHLTTVLKMLAYQVESDLVDLLRNDYARVEEEGRTLVQTALQATGALAPREDRLTVTLAPLSSAHRSRAVSVMCDALNGTNTTFPGSSKVLHYGVALPSSGQIGDGKCQEV